MNNKIPTADEILSYIQNDRNWGRWGQDDQIGAVNMIDNNKRLHAAGLVKSGRAVSLSREFPKTPAANNPTPAQHFMNRNEMSLHSKDQIGVL